MLDRSELRKIEFVYEMIHHAAKITLVNDEQPGEFVQGHYP